MSRISRRQALKGAASGLTVLAAPAPAETQGRLTLSAEGPPLASWIRIGPDGRVTAFTGKAELGQGITTAVAQLAAEGLQVPLEDITVVAADTAHTPNEGLTAGSHSIDSSGMSILSAAVHARELLIAHAARIWNVPPEEITTSGGQIRDPTGRTMAYGEIAAAIDATAPPSRLLRPPRPRPGGAMGSSPLRRDARAKVIGDKAFIHDLQPADLVHARVLRPPAQGLRLLALDIAAARASPGVVAVVRLGDFTAVAAGEEWQAAAALRTLERSAQWSGRASQPWANPEQLESSQALVVKAAEANAPASASRQRLRVRYSRPCLMHASIGPSCALARFEADALTIWTHSQGVFMLRDAVAKLMSLPSRSVRVVHVPGAGCYGHNGADDAACDAALIARALPGRCVRLQWTREQEHRYEPYGSAMTGVVDAGLDGDGRICDWTYQVSSGPHVRRPTAPGLLLAARELPDGPPAPAAFAVPLPEGDGHRNSLPIYDLPARNVTYRLISDEAIRVSSLRSLGAHLNVVAIEGAMDELAALAGDDPVAFRRRHLSDPRALAVIAAAADGFGWSKPAPRKAGYGRGFGFARYKNSAGYLAVALDVRVEPASGVVTLGKVFAACDVGQAVTPDGVLNQIEGGIIQSLSWTLLEAVRIPSETYGPRGWLDYPILRFSQLPERVDLRLLERPGEPFLGAGEIAAGPAAAALVNAVSNALRTRVRDLPLTPDRLVAVIRAARAQVPPGPRATARAGPPPL